MSLRDKRHFQRTGVLQDIAHNNSLRREETSLLREYDRSTKWIVIGSGSGAPAFGSGWSNYNAATYIGGRFMRDASGIVHVQGFLVGTTGTVCFTLPEGFRPSLALPTCGIAYTGTYQASEITILSNGQIVPNWLGGAATWVSLNTIHFPAEQ